MHEGDLNTTVPAPGKPKLNLDQWVAAVKARRAGIDMLPRGDAGRLVIDDTEPVHVLSFSPAGNRP
jgi:hypothetical protein